ncbi:MAG: type II secretion system protein [Bacillota bacterium]
MAVHWSNHRRGGFTLLEVIIIIGMMGFLAAMIVPFVGHLDNKQRIKATRERLEAVRTAIVGPQNTYDERGLRVVRGYAGDMDALPKLYRFDWNATDNCWDKPAPAAVPYDEVYNGGDRDDFTYIGQPLGLWEKFEDDTGVEWDDLWKGPYLGYPKALYANRDKDVSHLRKTEGVLADAWGRVLFFIKEQEKEDDPDSIYLLIISAGPDGRVKLPPESDVWPSAAAPAPLKRGSYKKDEPENRDNIVLEITPDEWYKPNMGVQEEQTRQILEEIRTALLGPPDAFDPSGRRIAGGYIGDMGRWPVLWEWNVTDNKWDVSITGEGQPRGLWFWHAGEGYSDHVRPAGDDPIGFVWRGPYLAKPWGEGADEVLRDAWGTALKVELNTSVMPQTLTITSAGRDKKVTAGDDNISMQITSDQWRIQGMSVRGSVKNETPKVYVEDPPGSGNWAPAPVQPEAELDLKFYHQPGEPPLTDSRTVRAGESVAFELSGEVFAGKRRLEVHIVQGVLKSAKTVTVFTGAGGTQSPVEEKLVIIVESPP